LNDVKEELSLFMFDVFRSFRIDIRKRFEDYLPINEFTVLRVLKEQGKKKVSHVATELQVSSSHITAASEKLIDKGLATRSRCDTDRRVVFLEVTEAGALLVEKMEALKRDYVKEKFSVLTDEELNMMLLAYRKLKG
jgi:DNA-binding MarR family transcriptional regulator